ncbi:MAG: hypothetical protein LBC18_02960 [Opitutaceae bacterium]|nr:hypothetical protein [Opitutaceae bacterium]
MAAQPGTPAKIEAGVRCVSDAELWLPAKAPRRPMERLFPDRQAEILAALEIREPL